MFRILQTLLWEYVALVRLMLSCTLAVMIAAPFLMWQLLILAGDGTFDSDAFPADAFYFSYLGIGFIAYSVGVTAVQVPGRRRLFTLPISTKLIVTWQFAVVALSVTFCNLLVVGTYRAVFGVDWPLLVPTLVMISFGHAFQFFLWQFVPLHDADQDSAGLLGISIRNCVRFMAPRLLQWSVVAVLGGGWIAVRHHPNGFAEPFEFWNTLSTIDVGALLAISIISWLLTLREVQRIRHGDHFDSPLFSSRNSDTRIELESPALPFASPKAAFTWVTTEPTRALMMAGGIIVSPILVMILWGMLTNRGHNNVEGAIGIMFILPMTSAFLIGGVLGAESGLKNSKGLPSFIGTVPLTDFELGRIHLRSAFRLTSMCWFYTLLAGSTLLIGLLFRYGPSSLAERIVDTKLAENLGWFAIPVMVGVSFASSWAIAGMLLSLAWTGRQMLYSTVFFSIIIAAVALIAVLNLVVPVESRESATQLVFGVLSALCLMGTGLAFWTAVEKRVLQFRELTIAVGCWMCAGSAFWLFAPFGPLEQVVWISLSALTILPLATGPLALQWNRHR